MKRWSGILIMFVAIFLILTRISIKDETILEKKAVDKKPLFIYGIPADSFLVTTSKIKNNQTLGEILYSNHVDHPEIHQIVLKSKETFDVRRINTDKKYTLFCAKDSTKKAKCFVYEEDAINYIVFDLREGIDVYRGKKEVLVKLKTASSTINSSLWLTINNQGLSDKIAAELSTIYAWTIDFFKIQKGDSFKIYYEDRYINDEDTSYIGIGKILASEFIHNGQKFYSFYYKENVDYGDYYDDEGKTLRKAFLMAPVDYKRISSRFSTKRKHPVTGQWKGHFGTDYAAEKGTPIWATANGTIIAASYTKNNGNYVKIRHNEIYTTQYLHMSKIKPGIKQGVYVEQGDCIGYVGSTGLATGPHVCYRFWKNGKQTDPFKEKLPPGEPINEENYHDYMGVKDSLLRVLIAIE